MRAVAETATMMGSPLAAGGTITVPIFAFPGGRRFHFQDPAGNELAVWSES
jgi:predicted enzyme related to lactoylglutathione lyase